MEPLMVVFFVPTIIFMVVVAPIWLVLHYKNKGRVANGLSDGERADVEEMIQVANRMAARIENLESILDVESPGWREKQQEA